MTRVDDGLWMFTQHNTTIVKGIYTPSQSWEVFAPRFGRGVWGSFDVLACQGPLHVSLISEIEHGILGSHSRTFLILWSIRDSKAFGFTSLTLRCVDPDSSFLESHPKHFLDLKIWVKKQKIKKKTSSLPFLRGFFHPICSMYGIFTYSIYPKNQPNVGKYAIHGAPGHVKLTFSQVFAKWDSQRPTFSPMSTFSAQAVPVQVQSWAKRRT